jgi:hypothetical protein
MNSKFKKSPKKYLSVQLDGKPFAHQNANEVFVRVLQEFGLDAVAELNLELGGVPLVSHSPQDGRALKQRDGWFIETHCSTIAKIGLLQTIASKLGRSIDVRYESDLDLDALLGSRTI